MPATRSIKFHEYSDVAMKKYVLRGRELDFRRRQIPVRERKLSYHFDSHFHPYVGKLVERLLQKSTSGLQAADTDELAILLKKRKLFIESEEEDEEIRKIDKLPGLNEFK